MDIETRRHPDDLVPDQVRAERAEASFWQTLATLYRWRRFIAGVTLLVAAASVVISLLLPNEYKAETRLLLPDGGGGGLLSSALLSNLPSAARSLLGSGGGGDFERYIAILSSRTVMERVVDHFSLIAVYELEDARQPKAAALKQLKNNVEFVIDAEYGFLSVEVLDKNPQRAAEMANFFVAEMNHLNAKLASRTASNFRQYIEKRYQQSLGEVDSLLNEIQAFQQRYGVFDLPTQTESFFKYLADLRGNTLLAEIQYEALRAQLGDENPQVLGLEGLARAADQKYREALQGSETILPVPQQQVPALLRKYADLERQRVMLTRILEVTTPLYEQARFDEQRKVEAVQIVDVATPPELKYRPKRMIIVLMATFSAFLLGMIYALAYDWLYRRHAYIIQRLKNAAEAPPSPHIP